MGGRGSSGGKRSSEGGGGATHTLSEIKSMRNPMTFDQKVFNSLPNSLKDDRIIAIDKTKTSDGTRYSAGIMFEDGFQRRISEYGFSDFKSYLDEVLHVNRKVEY